jgi:hypothetical protein
MIGWYFTPKLFTIYSYHSGVAVVRWFALQWVCRFVQNRQTNKQTNKPSTDNLTFTSRGQGFAMAVLNSYSYISTQTKLIDHNNTNTTNNRKLLARLLPTSRTFSKEFLQPLVSTDTLAPHHLAQGLARCKR